MILQKAFALEYGYQMCSLDFVGFILKQTTDGAHDISLVTPHARGTFSYSKIGDLDLLHSETTTRELCIAVDKTYGALFDSQECSPGLMMINSYGHNDDGSANYKDVTLRGYVISKSSIVPLDGETLEELGAPILGTGIYTYADAWPYDGMSEDGIIRGVIEEEWGSMESPESPSSLEPTVSPQSLKSRIKSVVRRFSNS